LWCNPTAPPSPSAATTSTGRTGASASALPPRRYCLPSLPPSLHPSPSFLSLLSFSLNACSPLLYLPPPPSLPPSLLLSGPGAADGRLQRQAQGKEGGREGGREDEKEDGVPSTQTTYLTFPLSLPPSLPPSPRRKAASSAPSCTGFPSPRWWCPTVTPPTPTTRRMPLTAAKTVSPSLPPSLPPSCPASSLLPSLHGDPAYPNYKKNAFDGGEDGM